MNAQKRSVNPQILLETLCCLTFAGVLLYLILTEGYQRYVAPKTLPYLYFSVVVMIVWSAAGLMRINRNRHRVRVAHCLPLLLPIVLLFLPLAPISSSSFSSGYLSGGSVSGSLGGSPNGNTPVQIPGAAEPAFGAELSGLDEDNRTITVSDSEFYLWITKLYEDPSKYEGYEVTMTGFVFRDASQMEDNQFVPARLMMTCCVSDLLPVGLLAEVPEQVSSLPETDSWVKVTGTLHYEEYEGFLEPRLNVTTTVSAEEVPGYLFPTY